MTKGRLEAFSDGVIAIVITIMVLELRMPEGAEWTALVQSLPSLMTYLLSFALVAIYWNNHHHMLHTVTRVGGSVLWANTHLLFWLSLVPFATAYMEEQHFAPVPTAVYGILQLLCAIAYTILQAVIIRQHGQDSKLKKAVGADLKGKISAGLYASSVPIALVLPELSIAIYVVVALMWLVPDRRIERALAATDE